MTDLTSRPEEQKEKQRSTDENEKKKKKKLDTPQAVRRAAPHFLLYMIYISLDR